MFKAILYALAALLFLCGRPASAAEAVRLSFAGEEVEWTALEPGLETALLSAYSDKRETGLPSFATIRVLRISPLEFDFRIHSALWDDRLPRTLEEWADKKQLLAVINAGMFQKDGLTATGYMRSGSLINNSRIASRYGAFFVCDPLSPGLPGAAIIDKRTEEWQKILPSYGTVVQNFRLMDEHGGQVWPKNGRAHSITALAQDKAGRILFLHCGQPLSVYDFVRLVNLHPSLKISKAMYMEGGKEAGLLIRHNGETQIWQGFSPARFLFGEKNSGQRLPNILGISRRLHRRAP